MSFASERRELEGIWEQEPAGSFSSKKQKTKRILWCSSVPTVPTLTRSWHLGVIFNEIIRAEKMTPPSLIPYQGPFFG